MGWFGGRKEQNLYAEGVRLAKKGRLRDAIELLKQAAKLDPHDARIRYDLGRTYAINGQPKEALSEFRLAIRFAPEDPDTYFSLGATYCALAHDLEAAACFRGYLDLAQSGEKARTARLRIQELGTYTDCTRWKDWLQAARVEYSSYLKEIVMVGVEGGSRLAMTSGKTDEYGAVRAGLDLAQWLMEDLSASVRRWAAAHCSASAPLMGQKRYGAATVQIIEAVNCDPHNESLLTPLALIHALAGLHPVAVCLVRMIDTDKLEQGDLEAYNEVVATLRDYGHL